MPPLPTLVPEIELAQTWPHSCQGPQTSAAMALELTLALPCCWGPSHFPPGAETCPSQALPISSSPSPMTPAGNTKHCLCLELLVLKGRWP